MTARWPGQRDLLQGRSLLLLAAATVTWMVLSGAVWLDASAAAPTPVSRPTGRTPNCTEGQCHAKQREFKFLHGPMAVGACDACHSYSDEAKHTFQLKRSEKELCSFCHVGMQVGKSVHKPVAEGQCLGCHNPHGSTNREMLRSDNIGSLCASCHGDVTKGRKQAHGPVASGNCAACHNAHTSEFPKLLVNEGRALCLGCHKEMAQQMQKVKSLHKPVEGDCLQCHEAHASSQIKQLKAAPLDLCVSCHAPIKKMAQEAAFKHSAVTEGQACLNCHTSHGSDLAKLMKSEPAAACLACHDKAITRPGATVVAAVTEISQPGLFKHGPIRDGNCSGCHTPHGGPLPRLLSQPYPETFYQPFKVDAYALCFSCHDKQLVLAQQTEGLTRFRNGTLNLHYVHVNKPERGRSCYSCHSTHASALPSHVRESVPYGNWEIPLNFKTTATGGSCAPGCHRAVAYDRQNAAANLADVPPAPGPVAPPAAQPAPPAGPLPAPSAPSAAVPSGVTSGAEKKDEEKKP